MRLAGLLRIILYSCNAFVSQACHLYSPGHSSLLLSDRSTGRGSRRGIGRDSLYRLPLNTVDEWRRIYKGGAWH